MFGCVAGLAARTHASLRGYGSDYDPFFKTDTRLFPAIEFLVQLLQHLPDSRSRLIRTYGLYSSRARGTPCPAGALARREGGPVALTSSAYLPRAGSATSTPAIPPHRSTRGAEARAVDVGQAEPRRMSPPDQEDLGIPYQLRAIQQVRTLPFALLTRSTHGSTRSFARSNAVMAGAKTGCTFVTGTVMAPRCRFRGPIWPRLIRSLSSPLGRLVFVPETCWNSLI